MPRCVEEEKSKVVVQLVDTPQWAEWLSNLSRRLHMPKAMITRLALAEFAISRNLPEPPESK